MMTTALKEVRQPAQDGGCGAAELLFRLQMEQFEHDERYHREIARLNMHHRLNHMALHFAKYAGKLVEADDDREKIQKTVTDTFIIALSCSNTLNFRMWDRVRPSSDAVAEDLVNLGWQLQEAVGGAPTGTAELARWVTVAAGRMAAACEKVDHLEPYPFRQAIEESVANLVKGCFVFASPQGWDLARLVRGRLQGVKEKSILHGYL